MNTRERGGIEFIRLYTKGRHSKEWRGESVYGQRIREKCDQCSSFLTNTASEIFPEAMYHSYSEGTWEITAMISARHVTRKVLQADSDGSRG